MTNKAEIKELLAGHHANHFERKLIAIIESLMAQLEAAKQEIARLTATWCVCGHVREHHDFYDDHDECNQCPSDGPPHSCTEFRPEPEPRE